MTTNRDYEALVRRVEARGGSVEKPPADSPDLEVIRLIIPGVIPQDYVEIEDTDAGVHVLHGYLDAEDLREKARGLYADVSRLREESENDMRVVQSLIRAAFGIEEKK